MAYLSQIKSAGERAHRGPDSAARRGDRLRTGCVPSRDNLSISEDSIERHRVHGGKHPDGHHGHTKRSRSHRGGAHSSDGHHARGLRLDELALTVLDTERASNESSEEYVARRAGGAAEPAAGGKRGRICNPTVALHNVQAACSSLRSSTAHALDAHAWEQNICEAMRNRVSCAEVRCIRLEPPGSSRWGASRQRGTLRGLGPSHPQPRRPADTPPFVAGPQSNPGARATTGRQAVRRKAVTALTKSGHKRRVSGGGASWVVGLRGKLKDRFRTLHTLHTLRTLRTSHTLHTLHHRTGFGSGK